MRKLLLFITGLLAIFPSLHAQEVISPQCMGDKYHEFDFWIGEWEVYTEDRGLVGTNSIRSVLGGCLIQENYYGMQSDYNGSSYNFYDKSADVWRQIWVDNKGENLMLSGGLQNGEMVMASDTLLGQDSISMVHRISWSVNEDASVEQHWQLWKEDSGQWETLFKGSYIQRR